MSTEKYKSTLKAVTNKIHESNFSHEDTIIIVEASKDTTFDYIEDTDLEIYKEKDYKSNKHVFIRMR